MFMYESMNEVVKAGDQHVRDDYLRTVFNIASTALEKYPERLEKIESHLAQAVGEFCASGFTHRYRRILRCTEHLEDWVPAEPITAEDWLYNVCRAAMVADVRAELERLCRPL